MSDEEKSAQGEFRVVDKRRFTSEGETKSGREESPREERAAEQPVRKSSPVGSQEHSPQASEAHGEAVDFSSLIVSLATQALMMMGEVPNAEAGPGILNLDAAKQTIDVLALLEQKTKGNLTSDEQKLMAEILTSLRLAFVKKSGRK